MGSCSEAEGILFSMKSMRITPENLAKISQNRFQGTGNRG